MNQYQTSIPAVSFRIIWRIVARQSSNELSQSLSAGATCAEDGVANVSVSASVVRGMMQRSSCVGASIRSEGSTSRVLSFHSRSFW